VLVVRAGVALDVLPERKLGRRGVLVRVQNGVGVADFAELLAGVPREGSSEEGVVGSETSNGFVDAVSPVLSTGDIQSLENHSEIAAGFAVNDLLEGVALVRVFVVVLDLAQRVVVVAGEELDEKILVCSNFSLSGLVKLGRCCLRVGIGKTASFEQSKDNFFEVTANVVGNSLLDVLAENLRIYFGDFKQFGMWGVDDDVNDGMLIRSCTMDSDVEGAGSKLEAWEDQVVQQCAIVSTDTLLQSLRKGSGIFVQIFSGNFLDLFVVSFSNHHIDSLVI